MWKYILCIISLWNLLLHDAECSLSSQWGMMNALRTLETACILLALTEMFCVSLLWSTDAALHFNYICMEFLPAQPGNYWWKPTEVICMKRTSGIVGHTSNCSAGIPHGCWFVYQLLYFWSLNQQWRVFFFFLLAHLSVLAYLDVFFKSTYTLNIVFLDNWLWCYELLFFYSR